jgi:hypothetical protein
MLKQPGLRIRITLMRIRLQLLTLMPIRLQPLTLMRIRIQLFHIVGIRIPLVTQVMRICDSWSIEPSGHHSEPLSLNFERQRPSTALHFKPLKLLENFDFNADPDPVFSSVMRIRIQILRLMGIPADSDPATLEKITHLWTCTKQRQMNGLTWCWGRRAGRSRCTSPHQTADGILGRSSPFFSLLWCSTFVNTTSINYYNCYCCCGSYFHMQSQKTTKNVACGFDTAGGGVTDR